MNPNIPNQPPMGQQPIQQQYYQPPQTSAPQPESRNKTWIWIVLVIVILILIGFVMYFMGQLNTKTTININTTTPPQEENVTTNNTTEAPVTNTTTSTQTPAAKSTQSTKPVSSSQPASTPAITITVADFKGEWKGSYTANPLAGKTCGASGETSFSIGSTGTVVGYAMINGIRVPATGKVTKEGNLSGSWDYSGVSLAYTAKLNLTTNTGSGTYLNNFGCFGSFSVSRQ